MKNIQLTGFLPTLVVAISISMVACTTDSEDSTTNNNSTTSSGSSSSSSSSSSSTSTDITDIKFSARDGSCADYIDTYFSNVIDSQTSEAFSGNVSITTSSSECTITSNEIPNHNFNVNGNFATKVSAQSHTYTVVSNPSAASSTTALELGASGIFLNGVKLDILPAACYGVGSEPLGQEKIGCGTDQINNPWRYDPMSTLNTFGTDDNNAHTQPDGAYHYHGDPLAMFDTQCESSGVASPVIGFAADGFPIFGYCFNDSGTVRKATSSYQLKTGTRQAVSGYTTPTVTGSVASTSYDGQFRGDWEYVNGAGDLDECNGMTNSDGVYGYYVTDTFPWVMNCLKGTKNSNFIQ